MPWETPMQKPAIPEVNFSRLEDPHINNWYNSYSLCLKICPCVTSRKTIWLFFGSRQYQEKSFSNNTKREMAKVKSSEEAQVEKLN